jgi:hypothetical protein
MRIDREGKIAPVATLGPALAALWNTQGGVNCSAWVMCEFIRVARNSPQFSSLETMGARPRPRRKEEAERPSPLDSLNPEIVAFESSS